MSARNTFAVVLVVALVGGAVALEIHERREVSRAASVEEPAIRAQPAERAAPTAAAPGSSSAAELPQPGGTKKLAAPPMEASSPIRAGETWDFSANVSKLNAVANLKLKVAEKRDFMGKSAWHLQAFAHTENPLRMVFALDDQFDSYSDVASLVSMQYEMHLNERGETVNSVQRLTASGREPAPGNAAAARVLPGTRDPLGMMQYLRTVDWAKTPEVHGPVYDGHKLYEARARLVAKGEAVTVPAGNFNTLKIELRVFENGVEMKDAHFTLSLSDNEARTPVLLEALMPFATARVELVKAQ